MDRRCWLLCVAMWVLGPGVGFAQEELDLGGMIDKAIVAAGGKEKLSKLNAQTWKSKITVYSIVGNSEQEGVYSVEWPNKFRSEIKDAYTLVRNGDEAWIKQGEELEELVGDRLLFLKEDLYVNWLRTLVPLRGKEFRYRPVPSIEVDEKPTVGVRVSSKGHRDVVFLFDKQTYLVVKVESKSRGMGVDGELANIETYYSDYQEVAGTKVPTRVKVYRDGELFMEIENSEIVRKEKFAPAVFSKPE